MSYFRAPSDGPTPPRLDPLPGEAKGQAGEPERAVDDGPCPPALPEESAREEGPPHDDMLARYGLAITLCPVPALLADARGHIRHANLALDRLFGYDPGTLIGQSVEVLVPQSSRDRHPTLRDAFFMLSAQRGMGQGREVFGQHLDGNLIPIEIGLSPVPLGAEKLVFTTVVDISERRLNERRLREALDASATAMVLVAPDGMIELVNTMACELLGGAPRDLVGRNVDSFVPRKYRLQHSVYRQSYLSAPRPRSMSTARELHVVGLDGRATPVHIALTPINGVQGQRIMATLVDLTDIHAKEQELQHRNASLSALNDELTQFAYSASHDLRAPLATIAGLLELCLEDLAVGETAETRRNITDALTTARRNINKVEQVLTLARAGLDAVPEEQIDLISTVQAIWDDMSHRAPRRPGFTVSCRGPGWIVAERPTLVAVIENLLANACHFQDPTKDYPWIELRLDTTALNRMELTLCDNGPGIAEADQPRIFDMFRRSARSGGHGLGLAIVQKHVRRLNGTISVKSSPAGTCFTLSVPIRI